MAIVEAGVYECREVVAGLSCRNLRCLLPGDAVECEDCGGDNWLLVYADSEAPVGDPSLEDSYRATNGEDLLLRIIREQPDAEEVIGRVVPDAFGYDRWTVVQSETLSLGVRMTKHFEPLLRGGTQVGEVVVDIDYTAEPWEVFE